MTVANKTFTDPFDIIPEAASGQALGDATHAWDLFAGDITIVDDAWIGLGAAAGRVVFDSTPAPDVISFQDCYVAIGPAPPSDLVNVSGLANSYSVLVDLYSDTVANKAAIELQKSHQNTVGLTETIDNEQLGIIRFRGVDDVPDFDYGAYILAVQDGAAGDFVPTQLWFRTYSDSAANTNHLLLDGATGFVGINDGTPGTQLEVVGTVTATKFTDTGGGYDFFMPNPSKPNSEMLRHWAIETDGMRTLYTGQGKTDATGLTMITLPEWFNGLAQVESCTLTPLNGLGNLTVNLLTLQVESENPLQAFCWLIIASRIDKMAQNILADHPVIERRDSGSRKHVKYIWNEISSGDMIKPPPTPVIIS